MTLADLSKRCGYGLVASVSDEGGAAVVALRCEADLFTLPVVVDVLAGVIADHDGPIIIDLAHTEFLGTSTGRALAAEWQVLHDHGRTLALRSPSRLAARVLGLLGLSGLIEPDQMTAA